MALCYIPLRKLHHALSVPGPSGWTAVELGCLLLHPFTSVPGWETEAWGMLVLGGEQIPPSSLASAGGGGGRQGSILLLHTTHPSSAAGAGKSFQQGNVLETSFIHQAPWKAVHYFPLCISIKYSAAGRKQALNFFANSYRGQ